MKVFCVQPVNFFKTSMYNFRKTEMTKTFVIIEIACRRHTPRFNHSLHAGFVSIKDLLTNFTLLITLLGYIVPSL